MSERGTPTWTERLDEPFRSDPSFSRSVRASADAFALTVVAVVAAVTLQLSGARPTLVVLPFAAPVFLLAMALVAAHRFHHAVDSAGGMSDEQPARAWRDRERQAVARSFGPALIRNRMSHG
jgi:hypothetical protein